MELSFDIGAAVLAAIALWFAYRANIKAEDANRISEEALRLSKQQHAVEMRPAFLVTQRSLDYFTEQGHYDVWLILKNTGNGEAAITSINTNNLLIKLISPDKFPKQLHSNNTTTVRLNYRKDDFQHYWNAGNDRDVGLAVLHDMTITIHFSDTLGNDYFANLSFNLNLAGFAGDTGVISVKQ